MSRWRKTPSASPRANSRRRSSNRQYHEDVLEEFGEDDREISGLLDDTGGDGFADRLSVLAEHPVHPDFDSEGGGPTIGDDDSTVRENLFEFVDDVPEEADAPGGSP